MSKRLTFLSVVLLILLLFSSAEARVWVVHPDGTGDAPTIQAAIDSLYNFGDDVIELVDGVFTGPGNRDLFGGGWSFVIKSQSGDPTSCILDLQGSADEWHWGIAYAEDG